MGRFDGKVAFITGAARGQGRSHAIELAKEGADIIAVDICDQIDSVPYPMSTPDDLAETVRQIEELERRIVSMPVDVRDDLGLRAAVDVGIDAFGSIDVVLANAGIAPLGGHESQRVWQDVIDVNLTGVFNTIEAVIPGMIKSGRGGAIVLISSIAGLVGMRGRTRGSLAYAASKHALVGLMRSYANNLAEYSIRVNSVHPTGVNTPMVVNEAMSEFLRGSPLGSPGLNALPIDILEPVDVSNALLWLASDDARYVTGVALPVDAGAINKR